MRSSWLPQTWLVVAASVASTACQCGPVAPSPDGGTDVPPLVSERPDAAGVVVLPYDASVRYPELFAGEACPPETYGQVEGDAGASFEPDGSVRFGLCIVLKTLTAEALLNDQPAPAQVELSLLGGGFTAHYVGLPDPYGRLDVKIMRSRYDLLKYWPHGVFATHEGYEDFGFLDMTKDQQRSLAVRSHLLRGAARFGGLPFVPNTFPQDVSFTASGSPVGQRVAAVSQGGAYEVSLLEGSFVLFLHSPPQALYGTQLRSFQLNTTSVTFDRDQEYDVDVPTSLLEGSITLDGRPIPDRRLGADYTLHFVKPGDGEASVITHHEGGLPGFAALVPKNAYGVKLDFVASPDRHLPSEIVGKPLSSYLDLRSNGQLAANLNTFNVEGAITIDGQPMRLSPSSNWRLYLFGAANASEASSMLIYDVPQDQSAFALRVFPGMYTTVLQLNADMAEDLATGYWVVDRYFQVRGNTTLPIAIDTALFTGHLLIDGQPAPAGQSAGTLVFRNRAQTGQYSWFRATVTTAADGFFRVRLPKGEYEVFFVINPTTFPTYAQGRQLMVARVKLDEPVEQDLHYDTVTITGPLRVSREVVADRIGGPEVGLVLTRQADFQDFRWAFEGGPANYVLRVPKGDYALDFVINEGAIDQVAWGTAPMGVRMNLLRADGPLELVTPR